MDEAMVTDEATETTPLNPIPDSLKKWVEYAKSQKMWAVEKTQRGDIPPTVLVERDNDVVAIIIAPQIDKRLGLQAAAMCQAGFDPDALTVVFDAHIHQAQKKEGQTIDEAEEEFRKKFPPGSMQKKCDEEGACDTGEITDCLVCHRITREGKIAIVTLPYAYHGKDGPPFRWLDNDPKYKGILEGAESEEQGKGLELRGMIPNALKEIMSQPPLLDQVPQLKELAGAFEDFSPERTRFHTARAMMSLLSAQKFMVVDFTSGKHPEWTNAKATGLDMVTKMCNEGFLPREAEKPVKEVIEAHVGTPLFRHKMTALLTENSYWLPAEVRDDVSEFVLQFESVCMSPVLPGEAGDDDEEEGETVEGEGKRVRVWNGDRSEYLGEGNYVGDVKVWAIQMEDGSLRSNTNAEVEPKPEDVPPGGKVRSVGNNPKIVLDNGQTVYGCQVWWEPVESEHKHHAGCNHNHA